MKVRNEYPVHLLAYPACLTHDAVTVGLILTDEYLFATYIAAMVQGLQNTTEDHAALEQIIDETLHRKGVEFRQVDLHDIKLEEQDKVTNIVERMRAQFGEQVTSTYVSDFFIGISLYRAITGKKREMKESVKLIQDVIAKLMAYYGEKTQGTVNSITTNLFRLTDVMGLTEVERRLVELNLLFTTDVRMIIFKDLMFQLVRNVNLFSTCYQVMLRMADAEKEAEVLDALGDQSKPIALGIVSYDRVTKRLGKMSEFWAFCISNYAASEEKFFSRFIEELPKKKKTYSGAIANPANDRDEEVLAEFIKISAKIGTGASLEKGLEFAYRSTGSKDWDAKENDSLYYNGGLNALVYGSQKLDKLGYVSELIKNVKAYQVRTRDSAAGDMPSICYVAQHWLADTEPKAILIVNKAEQALTKRFGRPSWMMDMFGEDPTAPEKKELESDELVMLKNPVPTIWIANAASRIDSENVGRFLVHLELKGGSRKDRREEIEKIITDLGYSKETIQTLSRYVELSVEQIKSAAKMVKLMDHDGKGEEELLHLIKNSQHALGRDKMEDFRTPVTKYSLDYLNIRGNLPVPKIIQAFKKRGQGTACFYGLPGSGKTQLVEHMAMELDMPLIMKPASELLSKWVGESEKLIAEAFQEARDEGAILFIDEGDSFLRDRALAQRSWEITQVNELLQRMERHEGIFILATNLFQAIDAAALRRFTFKLEFLALNEKQRTQMLANECDLTGLSSSALDKLQTDLMLIPYLTPGDFATVKRQSVMLEEELTMKDWIDRLTIECRAKEMGVSRNNYAEDETFAGVTTKLH